MHLLSRAARLMTFFHSPHCSIKMQRREVGTFFLRDKFDAYTLIKNMDKILARITANTWDGMDLPLRDATRRLESY